MPSTTDKKTDTRTKAELAAAKKKTIRRLVEEFRGIAYPDDKKPIT